ncbi:MAG: amidinotransferase [Bacteroidetes bacterium]|nr:amidinotransferase [Bacteroidota bacterium]
MNHDLRTMSNQQTTSTLLMIRPVNFGFNEQTAGSNAFQNKNAEQQQVQDKALKEFDGFISVLRENGVEVIVIDDTVEPHKPDSIFPNNWISFHGDGTVFLYPMMAENRRLERREDIIRQLKDEFTVKHIIDLSRFERDHKFLEGTGSMVFDREHKIAYACLSPRTDKEVLEEFCHNSGYKPVVFHAVDENGKDIYHTNVLMCVGNKFAVICLDSIKDAKEREAVLRSFQSTQKKVVTISFDQMNHFAGNMLEVQSTAGEELLVMSKSAWDSLSYEQKAILSLFCKPVYAEIGTIEQNGGGSARCMMAEVHLPRA